MPTNVSTPAGGPGPSPLAPATPSTAPSATVPIAVYRKLATELKTTRHALQVSQAQQAQLLGQNERLRVEIERLAQAALALQTLAAPTAAAIAPPPFPTPNEWEDLAIPPSPHPVPAVAQAPGVVALNGPVGAAGPEGGLLPEVEPLEQLFAEEGMRPYTIERGGAGGEPAVGGWGMTIAVVLIAAAAFGISLALVRPLTPGR